MSDTTNIGPPRSGDGKSWHDQLPAIVATALSAGIITIGIAFGGRVFQTTSATDVLVAKFDRLEKQNDTQEILLRDLLKAQAMLYTREEARADREAAERRFQRVENRIDAMEMTIRMMQQQFGSRLDQGRNK